MKDDHSDCWSWTISGSVQAPIAHCCAGLRVSDIGIESLVKQSIIDGWAEGLVLRAMNGTSLMLKTYDET